MKISQKLQSSVKFHFKKVLEDHYQAKQKIKRRVNILQTKVIKSLIIVYGILGLNKYYVSKGLY